MSGHRILIRDSPVAFVPVAVLVQSHVPRPLVFEAELLFDLCDYANLLEELDDILLLHLHRDGFVSPNQIATSPVRSSPVRKGDPYLYAFSRCCRKGRTSDAMPVT